MTYQEAARWLRERESYLILTHKNPDGDTVGCAAALCEGLRALGKTAHICPGTGETRLFTPYLEGYLAPAGVCAGDGGPVDIAARSLFTAEGKKWLERGIDLAIDHHPSQEFFAAETCLDAGRAACGELIYDILRELGDITPAMAVPLYVAVSTDTGCFQYGNTTAATHRVAAALMETGIDVFALNKRHFRTKSWARLQVERLITERMHRYDGGTIAVAPIALSLLEEAGATEEDLEDIAAFPADRGCGDLGHHPGEADRGVQALCSDQRRTERYGGVRPSGRRRTRRRCGLLGAGHAGGGGAGYFGCHPGRCRPMANGILIIDKPQDWTSHDVVARCRRLLHERRGGPRRDPGPDGHRSPARLCGQSHPGGRVRQRSRKGICSWITPGRYHKYPGYHRHDPGGAAGRRGAGGTAGGAGGLPGRDTPRSRPCIPP